MVTSPSFPRTALVLAAGLGSRIRALANDRPKPLLRFGGRPILAHNLSWLAASGIDEVFINLHYGADQIRDEIGDGSDFGLKITYVFEPTLLGTAGALANIPASRERAMWVVYGDSVVRCDLMSVWARHCASPADATLVLFDQTLHANTGIAGGRVQLDRDGAVEGFIEGPGEGFVNAGVYVVEPQLLNFIEPGAFADFGRDIFPAALLASRPLKGAVMEAEGFCLGLDTPESFAAGKVLLEQSRVVL